MEKFLVKIIGGDAIIQFFNHPFNKCLDDSGIPVKWESTLAVLLFKKESKQTLTTTVLKVCPLLQLYKLLLKIITIRFTNNFDHYQPVEPAGFRSGYNTMDHILSIRVIIEKGTKFHISLWTVCCFYRL